MSRCGVSTTRINEIEQCTGLGYREFNWNPADWPTLQVLVPRRRGSLAAVLKDILYLDLWH